MNHTDKRLPGFIDAPNPYGNNCEEWERHLRMLERLPENTLMRAEMIAEARQRIAQKATRH